MWGVKSIARQKGSSLVEMALTLLLFLMVVFGSIEFAAVISQVGRATEAARVGARFAVVNDPVHDLSGMSCPGSVGEGVNCVGNAACSPLVERMAWMAPGIVEDGAMVEVVYTCPASPPVPSREIYLVTVRISGLVHHFVTPGILGLEATYAMPVLSTTRTSEDLET